MRGLAVIASLIAVVSMLGQGFADEGLFPPWLAFTIAAGWVLITVQMIRTSDGDFHKWFK
ncbi:hypothetical protein LCGC14_3152770 [marine sediment metagenome]|uniref:Uncharacterized protein n=1 Tax=marine sediment metagenome TaxID=412755 RepID=A0A0F8YI08_9ZZZZ